ncbi:MAG: hypothetical protein ACXV7F_09245 [Methylomonas sp.]
MSRIVIIFMTLFSMIACSTESTLETPAVKVSSENSASFGQKTRPTEPPETGEPAMHAIQNSRLQAVMHQINTLVYDQLNNEINWNKERQLKAKEVARIANELAMSEKSITEALPALKLKPDEEAAFVALAEKLRTNAVQMEQLASQNQLQRLPETLETITDTCISCHVLFRKSRGLLEKCKDPRYTC